MSVLYVVLAVFLGALIIINWHIRFHVCNSICKIDKLKPKANNIVY